MEENIIKFETAKLAKEKGFTDEYPNYSFNQDGVLMPETRKFWGLPAPTQSVLEEWLFMKHEIQIELTFDDAQWYIYVGKFAFPDSCVEFIDTIECKSFKDAINKKKIAKEFALVTALKMVK